MARRPDFDLAAELAKPSFTPAQRDAPALVELVIAGDERVVPRAGPALASLADAGRAAVVARLEGEAIDEGAQARLVAVLGLLARAGDVGARTVLLGKTRAPHPRVRKAAAVALGKLGGDEARAALLARWDATDATPDERRALAEALGKVGGDEALARLRALQPAGDSELERRRDRAVLMANRDGQRSEDSTIATDVAPPASVRVRLACRAGLAELLRMELSALGFEPEQKRDDAVDVSLGKPWAALFGARLWASAAIRVPLRTGGTRPDGDALADAIAQALTQRELVELLARWTRGPIRWRLGMAQGTQRSLIWRVAKEVTRREPRLVNDPTQTTWDVRVDAADGWLEITPKRYADPRFSYRVAEVPAASHPTVAAALALVADVRPGDRVWDPFCGSGLELIERAKRGPVRTLLGTDLDEAALVAARANAEAAGVTATFAIADARTHAAGPVDLIITNPPLGSRVKLDAAALLVGALPHFVQQLAPRGRLVWITPAIGKTTPVATRLGLRLARSLPVDLGGVRGQLERWDKP